MASHLQRCQAPFDRDLLKTYQLLVSCTSWSLFGQSLVGQLSWNLDRHSAPTSVPVSTCQTIASDHPLLRQLQIICLFWHLRHKMKTNWSNCKRWQTPSLHVPSSLPACSWKRSQDKKHVASRLKLIPPWSASLPGRLPGHGPRSRTHESRREVLPLERCSQDPDQLANSLEQSYIRLARQVLP